MFKKLFGGNQQPQKQTAAPVDTTATMEKLDNQIETIDKRAKVLEVKVNGLKKEALQKKNAKDQRGIAF